MIQNTHDNMACIFFCETKYSRQYIVGHGGLMPPLYLIPLFDTPFLNIEISPSKL